MRVGEGDLVAVSYAEIVDDLVGESLEEVRADPDRERVPGPKWIAVDHALVTTDLASVGGLRDEVLRAEQEPLLGRERDELERVPRATLFHAPGHLGHRRDARGVVHRPGCLPGGVVMA